MDDPNGKPEIRTELKRRLHELTPDQRRLASAMACARVLALPEYAAARTVMLFISMAVEIDTTAIAKHAWSAGKTVLVPRAHMAERSMEAVVIRDFDRDMHKTPIGVLEPVGGEVLSPQQIDLVIVPGLGFGPAGERIGRGAGFYDRFLRNPSLRAPRCGVAFEQQIIDGIPMSPTDAWLDMLITDAALRRFNVAANS